MLYSHINVFLPPFLSLNINIKSLLKSKENKAVSIMGPMSKFIGHNNNRNQDVQCCKPQGVDKSDWIALNLWVGVSI